MGLAEPDTAIQEQRIEAMAGGLLGDPSCARMSHFVWLADNECFEGETGIERAGDLVSSIRSIIDVSGRFWGFDNCVGGQFDDRSRGIADGEIDASHRGMLGLPERRHTRTMM